MSQIIKKRRNNMEKYFIVYENKILCDELNSKVKPIPAMDDEDEEN